MSEGYKNRIGNLIRDARKHRGLTQHQLADLLGTSQSAVNRIEKGHQNMSLEMLARIGAALDSEIVAVGAGPDPPARDRPDHAVRRDRRQDVQERRRRAAVRVAAQPGPHHAAQGRPDRGGQPAARGAQQPRRPDPLAQRRQRPRDRPARATSTSTTSTRRRRVVPARSSCSSARCCTASTPSSCRTPAAATSAPAPSSRTWPRCGPSASRSRPPTAATTPRSTGRSSRAARSCSPSAATPSPRTP